MKIIKLFFSFLLTFAEPDYHRKTMPFGHIHLIYKKSNWRIFVQWLCGVLTSHKIITTDKDFDFTGTLMERNCYYCDKIISIYKIKIEVSESEFKEIHQMTKKKLRTKLLDNRGKNERGNKNSV